MQKPLNLATLLVVIPLAGGALSACHPPAAAIPATRLASFSRLDLPPKVNRRNLKQLRQLYQSLDRSHPQRTALRDRLATYLIGKTRWALTHPSQAAAILRTFFSIAQLYDPAEVYAGKLKIPALAALAHDIAKAYAPRGDVRHVLPALCVRASLVGPTTRKKVSREVWRIIRWIDATMKAMYGPSAKGHKVIPVLERTARFWPSHFTLDTLNKVYLEQRRILRRLGPLRGFLRQHSRFSFPVLQQSGYNLARHYLWVNRPYEALSRLRKLPRNDQTDNLIGLLQKTTAPAANIDDHLRLGEEFEEHHPRVALRVCQSATKRFPKEARTHACVGRLAARTGATFLAVKADETAFHLDPANQKLAMILAKQYERRIFLLVDAEHLAKARRRLVDLQKFYRRVKKRQGRPLDRSLASVYYAVGFGLYNAGKIASGVKLLEESLAAKPSPQTLLQLALIHVKRRQGDAALANLARAEKLAMTSVVQRVYWQARIESLRARALSLGGPSPKATKQHERAVVTWMQFLRLSPANPLQAEPKIHMARSLFALGRAVDALEAIDSAIDVAPARRQTYPDVISLLVTRGYLPEALDAYHRALGRREVGEYLKAYCSFWVIGLARRAGKAPDPLALNYLKTLDGDRWYDFLARFALGKLTSANLEKQAKTLSQRTEAAYYQADRLLAGGKIAEAKALWKRVVDSQLMAFFEYDMAMSQLHHGPAKIRTQPVDRRKK